MSQLVALRESQGLTQQELARLSGVPAETICRIERGVRYPRLGTRRALSRALGIPIEWNVEVFGPWPRSGPIPREQ